MLFSKSHQLFRSTTLYAKTIYFNSFFNFTGKTETGHKFTTTKLNLKNVTPIYPPPGLKLEIPKDWTPQKFCTQIGGDLHEHHDKFTSVEEMLSLNTLGLKEKGLPVKQRKYLLRIKELMRRGLITFEYLSRRTCVKPVHKLTKPTKSKAAAKKKVESKGKGKGDAKKAAGKKE